MTNYEILGIEKDATQEQIKIAYRTLAKKYHPDVNDAQNAAAFFRIIQEAYEALSNPAKKAGYDDEYAPEQYASNVYENNYNDNYTYECAVQKPRKSINIVVKILLLPAKLITLILIPILAFLSAILGLCAGIASIISKIYVGMFVLYLLFMIFSGTFSKSILLIIVSAVASLIVFCLPYIVSVVPKALDKAVELLKHFVFGD